jgi:hypothetical protein
MTNHEKLVGTWKFNVDKTTESDPSMAQMLKNMPEMRAQFEEMLDSMSVIFGKAEITMKGMGEEETSAYTVVSQEGRTIVVEATEKGEEKKETLTFAFTDDDNIKGREHGKEVDILRRRSK